jgi:hypothetical protein
MFLRFEGSATPTPAVRPVVVAPKKEIVDVELLPEIENTAWLGAVVEVANVQA